MIPSRLRGLAFKILFSLLAALPLAPLPLSAQSESLLVSWETHGLNGTDPSALPPDTIHPDLAVHATLALGPGLSPGVLTNAWGSSSQFNRTTQAAALDAGQYFTLRFGPARGAIDLSIARIRMNLRLVQAIYEDPDHEVHCTWQYSLNGVTFNNLGSSPHILSPATTGAWSSDGVALNRFLGSVGVLQNTRSNFHLRFVSWLQPKVGTPPSDIVPAGKNYALNFGRISGPDLQILGATTPSSDSILLAWETQGLANSPDAHPPEVVHPEVASLSGLQRGPGLSPGSLDHAWGSGTDFNQTSFAAAIAAGQYFHFRLAPSPPGRALLLERLHYTLRLTESVYQDRAVQHLWQYRVADGPWHTLDVPRLLSPASTGPWDSLGQALPGLDLRGEISPAFTTAPLDLRLVSWSDSTAPYSLHFGRLPGHDLVLTGSVVPADAPSPPGVLVSQLPVPPLRGYTASPSLAILPDGAYVLTHDLFGPHTQDDTLRVFRSEDRGLTWSRVATVPGQFWSTVFAHGGALYLYGYSTGSDAPRYTYLRRSTDRGDTWSAPVILHQGGGGTPNTPALRDGRLWFAHGGTRAMSAPVEADLMDPASWSITQTRSSSTSWLDGAFFLWSEAQIVASPATGVVILPKVGGLPYTARIRATSPTTSAFNPATDFSFLPGGEKKFAAQYDAVSGLFYALSNPVLLAHADHPDGPALVRNTGALLASPDLISWSVQKILLYSPHPDYEGFQYFNFAFDGDDLAIVSRTAFDVGGTKPTRGHDSNLITFHRLENFRHATREQVLQPHPLTGLPHRYELTLNHTLAPLGPFTDFPLSPSSDFAFVSPAEILVREPDPEGRLLRFDPDGHLKGTASVAPPGTVFSDTLAVPPREAGLLPPAAPTGLPAWRLQHFGSPHGLGPADDFADPDQDGLPNLLEYALGGSPWLPHSAPAPRLLPTGSDSFAFRFHRLADPDLRYTVETSVDLHEWSTLWTAPGSAPTGPHDVPVPPSDLHRQFIRLRVHH